MELVGGGEPVPDRPETESQLWLIVIALYGVLLTGLGRNDEAIAQINQAIELDPLSSEYRSWLAAIAFFSRQYDLSIKLSENLSDDWAI